MPSVVHVAIIAKVVIKPAVWVVGVGSIKRQNVGDVKQYYACQARGISTATRAKTSNRPKIMAKPKSAFSSIERLTSAIAASCDSDKSGPVLLKAARVNGIEFSKLSPINDRHKSKKTIKKEISII